MPETQNPCGNCGEIVSTEAEQCPHCGSLHRTVSITLSGVASVARVGMLGIVADSPAAADRPHRIEVRTPLGATSTVQLHGDGTVQLDASGPPDVGTRGEPQVRDILLARFMSEGRVAKPVSGAQNNRGEDDLIELDGERLVVQITAIPPSAPFWGLSARGSASTVVHVDQVAQWIHEAMSSKSGLASKPTTIIAIDARHVGVVADTSVVSAYNSQYPNAKAQFGFHSVWLVGPTPSNCTLLG